MTAKPSPLPLPGYGLPLNWTPAPCTKNESRARLSAGETAESMTHGPRLFTNGWHLCTDVKDDEVRMPLVTLTETDMVMFMDKLTDRTGWESHVTEETAERWHRWQQEDTEKWGWKFSKETLEYVIQELRYKAKVFKETGLISLYHGDVVKSDVAIPKNLREALKVAAAVLEDEVITSQKKKREGMVKIVDPDYFNVVFGKTKVIEDGVLDKETCLQRMNSGVRIPDDPKSYRTYVGSYFRRCGIEYNDKLGEIPLYRNDDEHRKYSKTQWLACEVDISGNTPRILTYINGLHPREYAPIYSILEEILEKVIPAWNMSLTPLRTFCFKKRVKFSAPDYGDIEKWMEENGPKLEDFKDKNEPERELKDAQRKLYESKAQEFLKTPQVSEEFKEPDPSTPVVDLKADYGDRGLQVVVDMSNIYLTPQNPVFSDTPECHLEGIPNDHICAVAKYYYDIENVDTKGCLAFSQPEKVRPSFEENKIWDTRYEFDWLATIFGVINKKRSIKGAHEMDIRNGRLVTFPNLLFSNHNQLKLVDDTEHGHCKVLTMLLVDPNIRVISSAIVPCQQYDWWVKEMMADGGPLGGLPCELRMEVVKYAQKWSWSGSQYPKASQEKERLFQQRFARTKFPRVIYRFNDDSDEE